MAADGDEDVDPVTLRAQARAQRRSIGRLSLLIRASLRLVWASGRGLFVGLLALQVVAALALAGQVLAVQSVLAAVLALEDAPVATASLWVPVVLLAALTAVSSIVGAVQGHMQRMLGELVARSMWDRVLAVSTGVGLASFESPDFFNRLQRVQSNALSRPYQVTQGLIAMGGALAAGVGVGAALVSISPLLLPLLVLGGLPVLLSSRRESRLEFDFSVAQTPALRMRQYLTLTQTGRDEAKEVRAFQLSTWLHGRFAAVYATYLGDLAAHLRRRARLSVLGNLGSAIMLVLTFAALVWMILAGRVTVAGAGAAIVAIRMLATQVQALFAGVQRIFESGLFLDDLEGFLRLAGPAQEDTRGPEAPAGFGRVSGERVAFTYPGSEQPAVDGATVELRAGEIVALVGENGSGKTTLAKLLAGLYEPEAGAIRWDGTDIREWSPASVRARTAVIFQDFVRYALSAEENIAAGDVSQPADRARVARAARAAGAADAIEALPGGYLTPLSRLFAGGADLSGGQWQRVAIARAYYRDAPLVILDEPSAALDPRAEHELFTSLRQTLEGRTALVISHRFSTVRSADRIYVMDAGAVAEHGTHEELMAAGGQYAELFRVQAAAYLPPERNDAAR
ncbi:ABC transporter ATP-binding protein [Pseudactinotalea sp. HY158]|uniref:ABC transporter ATP-binding protein n=1 Tax=Pseudactinotalea sp. HY158 TaxID=2654547 RepID=UPI00129C7586|nr:ABC transporter ATP-binding protein [Pseudactinotalea sp. HY158]QGH68485.1 ATP-binding cassette domain-containing protein [Pseudactinotalea sp. HY158]